MSTEFVAPSDIGVSTATEGDIFDRLQASLRDPSKWRDVTTLLRSLSRPFLHTLAQRRVEKIDPLEKHIRFLARSLRSELPEDDVTDDPRYLLGRLETLLDLSGVAIDRSLSDEVLRVARRSRVKDVLSYIIEHGESRPTELSERLHIEKTNLSNILRFMETADLIRRLTIGKSTFVSMGPQGEAAYKAVNPPVLWPVASRPLGENIADSGSSIRPMRENLIELSAWLEPRSKTHCHLRLGLPLETMPVDNPSYRESRRFDNNDYADFALQMRARTVKLLKQQLACSGDYRRRFILQLGEVEHYLREGVPGYLEFESQYSDWRAESWERRERVLKLIDLLGTGRFHVALSDVDFSVQPYTIYDDRVLVLMWMPTNVLKQVPGGIRERGIREKSNYLEVFTSRPIDEITKSLQTVSPEMVEAYVSHFNQLWDNSVLKEPDEVKDWFKRALSLVP